MQNNKMEKLRILLMILIIILLISSFPIKHILGDSIISDLVRLIGLIMLICYIIFIKKTKS